MRPAVSLAVTALSGTGTGLVGVVAGATVPVPMPDYATSEAGNPFVDGWYADPDNEFYKGEYWVFPTASLAYDDQTYLDAFSSPDLVNWTKHPNVLVADDFAWARRAVWAPAPVARNGKYYLYFAANDIQSNDENGGIGVGVADAPGGPYRDAIGAPLIGAYYHGAQPIDQDVFVDDDGQAYIYYGGHGHANVARLNEDMVSLGAFDDGETFKEITPANYVEGPQMVKRNGVYYLFWSEGGWGGPDYAVSYAMSDSPTGPFVRLAKILQQDPAVATGSGHNGVIHVPGTDIYYIVYHRRPLRTAADNSRQLAYDRLRFNADGTIQPVAMLVHDNFADGDMVGWTTYGGSWAVDGQQLRGGSSAGGKALLNTDFADLTMDADVVVLALAAAEEGGAGGAGGDAGLVFRASDPAEGPHAFRGYYAGISAAAGGRVLLGRADGGRWAELASAPAAIDPGRMYAVRVEAVGSAISVSVSVAGAGEDRVARVAAVDGTYGSGMDGVRVFGTEAAFDNVNVTKIA